MTCCDVEGGGTEGGRVEEKGEGEGEEYGEGGGLGGDGRSQEELQSRPRWANTSLTWPEQTGR